MYNLSPDRSFEGYTLPVPEPGTYQVTLSTDDLCFGGQGRIYHQNYTAQRQEDGRLGFRLYLPSRTAVVLKK